MSDALTRVLDQALEAYSPAKLAWTGPDGASVQLEGPGGGLVSAVERNGVVPLSDVVSSGSRLEMTDAGVRLELRREGQELVLHVSWDGGPSYEERVRVPDGAPPAPLLSPSSTPTRGASAAPRASTLAPVSDSVAALHDASLELGIDTSGRLVRGLGDGELRGRIPAVAAESLGAESFREAHGLRANIVSGAMAGGIGSPEIVIAMGRAGLLGFYGAGGLPLEAVEESVARIKSELGDLPAGFNLLHNPNEPSVEQATVDLYLRHGCKMVSASAFMTLTAAIVRYRVTGISKDASGRVVTPHKVFAKVSRPETAEPFMRPPPKKILDQLVSEGHISSEQAELAATIPMAEDVTAEADSGGHTDGRPLIVLIPTFLRLRDKVMAEEGYADRGISIRVGAGGGLGDPGSVAGAFSMGADYVLTGSVNQATIEAGTSDLAKQMIAAAGIADCTTGPAPDMFELGAHVQVLGRGSMYAQRGGKLYSLYKSCAGLDDIPAADRAKIEKNLFKRPLAEVWEGTREYWSQRDPREVEKADRDPKHKMALTFRWYLGMTSRWARTGEASRKRDYQIWCGPSMGLFNDWVRGTWLEPLEARDVVAVSWALLDGAASLRRVSIARGLGMTLPAGADSPPPRSR
jgi:trans-AT polyketide synthase/acyltransferase/oxidoreductase domain-containing protein